MAKESQFQVKRIKKSGGGLLNKLENLGVKAQAKAIK